MGVNLRDLFEAHPVPGDWYAGKRIAVDGHNVAFRYLTSFRGRDGDVLRGSDGRVLAHLLGFTNLVRHLREKGAEPIVIWDGDVHPMKWKTVEGRIAKRMEAVFQAEEALAAGDLEAHQKHLRATTYLDPAMIRDCTRLLEAVGVAVVRAPYDGERFGAALCHSGHADAVATEDYDALVAGAPMVLRKAGGRDPFLQRLDDLQRHGLSPDQLRHIAILCGTDFHDGVKGLGAKTCVKMVRDHPNVLKLIEEAEAGRDDTRYHRLIRESNFTAADFAKLDQFLADLPSPEVPTPPKPDPVAAMDVAKDMGLDRGRVMACFC